MKLDYLSDHLKKARRTIADNRHGGMVLTGDDLETFVQQFDAYIAMAKALECAVSALEWNRRAAADREANERADRIADQCVALLDSVRTADRSNVVMFPGH